MTTHASSRERRRWLLWHEANGGNVSATARHFGIARSTLYRWLRRAAAAPRHPLRRRRGSRARRTAPQRALFFRRVVNLNLEHPRWGRDRVRRQLLLEVARFEELRERAPAASTIGRWLAEIRWRCPDCGGRDSHDAPVHALMRDLRAFEDGRSPR